MSNTDNLFRQIIRDTALALELNRDIEQAMDELKTTQYRPAPREIPEELPCAAPGSNGRRVQE